MPEQHRIPNANFPANHPLVERLGLPLARVVLADLVAEVVGALDGATDTDPAVGEAVHGLLEAARNREARRHVDLVAADLTRETAGAIEHQMKRVLAYGDAVNLVRENALPITGGSDA